MEIVHGRYKLSEEVSGPLLWQTELFLGPNKCHQVSTQSTLQNQTVQGGGLQSLIQSDDIGVAKLGQNPGFPVQILPTIFIFDLTGINYLNCNLIQTFLEKRMLWTNICPWLEILSVLLRHIYGKAWSI